MHFITSAGKYFCFANTTEEAWALVFPKTKLFPINTIHNHPVTHRALPDNGHLVTPCRAPVGHLWGQVLLSCSTEGWGTQQRLQATVTPRISAPGGTKSH